MSNGKAVKDGAMRSVPAIGGSLFLGPTLGAPVGGYLADKLGDGNGSKYTKAGVAIGVASLFVGAGTGGSGNAGVM